MSARMKSIRRGASILLMAAALLLSGCRARLVPAPSGGALTSGAADDASPAPLGEDDRPESAAALAAGTAQGQPAEENDGGAAKENPLAQRKEYDEATEAELIPGQRLTARQPGEGELAGIQRPQAQNDADLLDDTAPRAARQTEASENADQAGVDAQAPAAESALSYYTVLLRQRAASLYECKRLSVYWETAQAYETVFRASPEHQMILDAGAYDVSARLLQENLRVDDGWIARKNPDVIVKVAPSGGVTADAAAYLAALASRPGFSAVSAVRSRRVLLLAEELLLTPQMRAAATLLLAKACYPDLYQDVDAAEALRALAGEAEGALPASVYAYTGGAL